jgi:hypothetical protein
MSDEDITCRKNIQALMCCFCLFVKSALAVIATRAMYLTLCDSGSHGFVVVIVHLHSDK